MVLPRAGTRTKSRPRILFAIGTLDAGGSETQLVELLTRIHPGEVDAVLVTRTPCAGTRLQRRIAERGVPHLWLRESVLPPPLRPAEVALRYARILRSVRPDLVYPWLEETSVLLAPLARMCSLPCVVARRNVIGANAERIAPIAFAVRRAERMATLVTCNSRAVMDAALDRGIAAERLRLVLNGHAAAALPPPPAGRVSLGCVARFRKVKGHLHLLEALSRVRSNQDWVVDLAGDGPLLAEITQEIEHRRLSGRVRLLGEVHDIRGFWAQHHMAVLLSDSEGCPNALIEAAFAGRPIVATRVGGIPEVVEPGGGILVPPGNPAAAAQAIQRLIDDEDLRGRLGRAAHEQASQRFDINRFVSGHLTAIHEALAGGPGRRSSPGRRRP